MTMHRTKQVPAIELCRMKLDAAVLLSHKVVSIINTIQRYQQIDVKQNPLNLTFKQIFTLQIDRDYFKTSAASKRN